MAVKCLALFCRALCGGALLAHGSRLAGVLPPCWGFLGLLLFLICCFKITQQNLLSNSFIIFYKGSPPLFFFLRCCQIALLKIHGGSPLPDCITQFKYTTARGVECHYVNTVPETSVRLFVKSKLYLLRGWEGEHSCC